MSMENLGPYSNFHELNQDWFLNEFNKVIAQWKAMQKNFDSMQDAFNDLKSYVQDYFENLNVQNEIDNKLEDMLKNGELGNVISSELITVNTTGFLFIGDSYAEGYTPDGNITSWCDLTKNMCNIKDSDFHKYFHGGYGFATGNASFTALLHNAINDLNNQEKNNIKYIIVGGGFNDAYNTGNIEINIESFINLAKNNFKNATVVVAPIGWCCQSKTSSDHSNITYKNLINMIKAYRKATIYGGCYIPNIEMSLHHNDFFSSDFVHPNSNGQYQIAYLISNWIKARNFTTSEYIDNIGINAELNDANGEVKFNYTVNNNITTLFLTSFNIKKNIETIKCNGEDLYIGNIFNSGIYGENSIVINCNFIIKADNYYYDAVGCIKINNQKISINIVKTNNDHNDFLTLNNVTEIRTYNYEQTSFNSLTQ